MSVVAHRIKSQDRASQIIHDHSEIGMKINTISIRKPRLTMFG